MHSETMPGIRAISGVIRWLIELQIVIAVPALMGAAILIVGAELGGGSALAHNETFQSITSYAQAVGMEGAFVSILIQARRFMYAGKPIIGIVMILIGIVLGSVTSMAILIGNIESSFALTTAQALTFLGISAATWDMIRAVVFGVIAFADAYMFYVPKPQLTESEVQEQIRQKELRAQLQQKDAELLKQRMHNFTNFLNEPMNVPERNIFDPTQSGADTPIPGQINIPEISQEIYPAGTSNKTWTWRQYADFVREKYHCSLSATTAQAVIRQIGKDTKDVHQVGQPYVAPMDTLKRHAQRTYANATRGVDHNLIEEVTIG